MPPTKFLLILAALALAGCVSAPKLEDMSLDPLTEGSAKTVRATFQTRFCQWTAPSHVRYRRAGTPSWVELEAPALASGDLKFYKTSTWEVPVRGSTDFKEGELYEIQWIIPYYGNAPLYGCHESRRPDAAVFARKFAVTPAFAIAPPASVSVAPGGNAKFDIAIDRSAGFNTPVNLVIAGLPPGITVVPPAGPIVGSSRTYTVSAAPTVAPGSYTATLTGQSPQRTNQSGTLSIVVAPVAAESAPPPVAPPPVAPPPIEKPAETTSPK